jgi:hypothetical protein
MGPPQNYIIGLTSAVTIVGVTCLFALSILPLRALERGRYAASL